ncbi:MAG: helix-turn-helix transcriptional regulator [Saprospiraceae bacterium]|nr:helix-turn-helix transcriptional regulator [Saprospiraceae bacterium]
MSNILYLYLNPIAIHTFDSKHFQMNTAAEWNHTLHVRLVEIIQSRLGRDRHAKSELASSIGITNSVLYKRLSSHSSFTIGELVMLAKHFNISIDEWIYDKSQIAQVRLLSWHQPVLGIESYLQQLIGWIKKLQSIPDHQIRYATREVPGLYYFMNPMLGAFKIYTFARFSWNLPGFHTDIPFSMSLLSEYQQELMMEIWNLYSAVTTEEIWNPNIWDTTQQIIFYWSYVPLKIRKMQPLLLLI